MFPFSPETLLEVTHQRLAENAEAARRWRLAREARHPAGEARFARAGAAQRPALLEFLTNLSPGTVYRRFFAPRVRWSARDLERLAPDDDAAPERDGNLVHFRVTHEQAAEPCRG